MEETIVRFIDKDNYTALAVLPLYHIFGFAVNMLGLFRAGFVNILVTNPRDL